MKRSGNIRLVLIGGLSAGALSGCGPSEPPVTISTSSSFTNNHFLAGVGFYHAPFRGWFPQPYNAYDPATQRYYFGGQWGPAPYASITNISSPLPEEVAAAQRQRTDISRGGFGSTSRHHPIYS